MRSWRPGKSKANSEVGMRIVEYGIKEKIFTTEKHGKSTEKEKH